MKQNRSLAISQHIQAFRSGEFIGLLEEEFPDHIFDKSKLPGSRDRVFTVRNTLLTMVLTAIHEDKTLSNSVDLYYIIHQEQYRKTLAALEQQAQAQKQQDQLYKEPKVGRPKTYTVHLPKSLKNDISLNTAAFSKARDRVPVELTDKLFESSKIDNATNSYSHWHGHRVFIGDGTYMQMQDTLELRKQYEVKHSKSGSDGYPQGLLEVIIERGTGQLFAYKLDNRHVSELSLFYEMIDQLKTGDLLLLDDLYNCYEIISKCKRKGVELLVPAKRERSYELVEVIAPGDEIIRIQQPKNRSKWLEEKEPAAQYLIRRISCKSPEGKDYTLHTTILNKAITKEEIHLLYLTRWDIEIGIREIKTIMNINILRSKTPEMALKELSVTLATYNLIRKIIYASVKSEPFSPEKDLIREFYTANKTILIDKTGRVYNQWSTGRKRNQETNTLKEATQTKNE